MGSRGVCRFCEWAGLEISALLVATGSSLFDIKKRFDRPVRLEVGRSRNFSLRYFRLLDPEVTKATSSSLKNS